MNEHKIVWRTEVGYIKSSPVVAGGYLYAVNEVGIVRVFDVSGSEPSLVHELDLGEPATASPAVSREFLFVRTKSRLFCLRGAN
jgi:hypothetical protein